MFLVSHNVISAPNSSSSVLKISFMTSTSISAHPKSRASLYCGCVSKVFFFFAFCFLGLHPQQMEVPKLGVKPELQLPAYAIATATQDPNHTCDLHHSSRQCQILNPLSRVREQTCNLMVPNQMRYHCATTETPFQRFLISPC